MPKLRTWLASCVVLALGCGEAPQDEGTQGDGGPSTASALEALLRDPSLPLPGDLDGVGLFRRAGDLHSHDALARPYTPQHELWSNGSVKLRHLAVPPGEQVDTAGGEPWVFPVGTMIFKTFAYSDPNTPASLVPVETRVMRKTPDGWTYAAYAWRPDAQSAELVPLDAPLPVAVTAPDGTALLHEIPSRFECRTCHEASHHEVLGITELQAASIDHPDPTTRQVMGYMVGNCVHCHNDSARTRSVLDLHPERFLEQTVHRPTEGSGTAVGVRVVPGHPEASILLQSMTWSEARMGIRPMPPLGVQRLDEEGIGLVEQWIAGLDPAAWPESGESEVCDEACAEVEDFAHDAVIGRGWLY
jgi:hypothetical protein